MKKIILVLLLVASPALARDPVTGIEDSNDQEASRLVAQSGKICNVKPRSRHQVRLFRKHFACPSTGKFSGACPGWIVDHIEALKHCGHDLSTNMAWMSFNDAKAKDKWE